MQLTILHCFEQSNPVPATKRFRRPGRDPKSMAMRVGVEGAVPLAKPPESCGWLVLQRQPGESVVLEDTRDAQHWARVTLVNTDPITLALDLPGIGRVDLYVEPHQSNAKLGLRAKRTVHIAREEIAAGRAP
jgi:hypothetical protein